MEEGQSFSASRTPTVGEVTSRVWFRPELPPARLSFMTAFHDNNIQNLPTLSLRSQKEDAVHRLISEIAHTEHTHTACFRDMSSSRQNATPRTNLAQFQSRLASSSATATNPFKVSRAFPRLADSSPHRL